jgi:hypothetical protein
MVAEMFLTMIRRLIFALLLLGLFAGLRAHAQNAGVVGIYTGTIQVFTAQASGASSGGKWQCNNSPTPIACPVLPDHGYASQELFYCNTGFSGTIDLEWSPTGITGTFLPLVQASWAVDSACHSLQLGGYYPNLRATMTRSAGSLSAWYTASAAPVPLFSSGIGSNGPTAPPVCDQATTFGVTNAAGNFLAPTNTGDALAICAFSISFVSTPATGAVTLSWATSTACTSPIATFQTQTTASTPQTLVFPLPQRSPSLGNGVLCVSTTGGSAEINLSYASLHAL